MGLFGKKAVSPSVESLLKMDNGEIDKLLKKHGVKSVKSAKELRKLTAAGRRPFEGEKGVSALLAGLQGGGSKNYKKSPVGTRVHPSIHRATLQKEVQQAIRNGDRAAQIRLRNEAKEMGWI